jgi:signal transduction histidine kinase
MLMLSKLLHGGGKLDTAAAGQTFVVNVYSLMGFVSVGVFGALHAWVEHNPGLGYLELAGALLLIANALGLRLTGNIGLARGLFLSILMTLLIVMLASGGTQGTGIFWMFLFPVAAFFLTGKRQGVYWVAGLYAVLATHWILARSDVIQLYYADIVIRQIAVTVFIVTLGLYVYEATRERSERKSREADTAKSEFITLASHQLRTPVSAIKWFGEILLSGDAGKLTAEQREHIEHMYHSNQRLAVIVDQMLMISSVELGNLPLRAESLEVGKLMQKVVHEQTALYKEKHLKIVEDYGHDLPKISLDAHIIKVILQNLVTNAIKYTPAKGSISIEVTQTSEKLHPASQGSIAILISDSGYGIPAVEHKQVFTKFFRADNIKNKDTDGTGLGLYIVRSLVKYMGGRVSFTSTENTGSTFVVLLPLEGMPTTWKDGGQ